MNSQGHVSASQFPNRVSYRNGGIYKFCPKIAPQIEHAVLSGNIQAMPRHVVCVELPDETWVKTEQLAAPKTHHASLSPF